MDIETKLEFVKSALVQHHQQTTQAKKPRPLNNLKISILRSVLLKEGSYQAIADSYHCTEGHVKKVAYELWKELSDIWGVKVNSDNLESVIETELQKQHKNQPHSPSIILPDENRDFVGRDAAINEINNLVSERHKIIVIQAAGGVGKTTLAKKYLTKFDLILPLEMAKDTENITAVESVIEEWLKQYFQEEPGREFRITLDRLKLQLQNRKIGVLIDNLEPALDKQGRFIEKHNLYVELLRVLADDNVQSITLITSRERLCDDRVNDISHYPLSVLDVTAWEEFFASRKIKIDTPSLEAMHKIYGGNAKAMDILLGVMRTDYDGDMSAYWQENCTLVETELKNLVESQFKRLQTLDTEAYKLFCRLGCFRYQDVPRVSIDALLALLWDIPEDKRRDVIKSLRNRCLVEFEKSEYWLHPVIREQGIERLKASGEWEKVNRKAAEFWTESVKTVETIEDAKKAFEAYHHYVEINDYEEAAGVIVKERDNKWETDEALGRAFYRLGLLSPLIETINKIINDVYSHYSLMILYNILGDLYWLTGYIDKAIKAHYKSGKIATKFNSLQYKIHFLFNTGLCYLDLWELKDGLKKFNEVISIAENTEHHADQICAWCCLAFINSQLGFYESALFCGNRGYYDLLNLHGITAWGQGYSLLFLGLTYTKLGDIEKSIQIYYQAILFAEESNYTQVKAKALYGLAELYRIQYDFKKALSHHAESIEILDKIGAKCDLAEAYYQLGLTYQKMGETQKSHTNFNEAIRLFNEMEAPNQVEKVEKVKIQN